MDKDGRGRNRLSHTSAPMYYAKSKRPAPADLDGVGGGGATNRLPGGQQQSVSRRQRSLHIMGKPPNPAPSTAFPSQAYRMHASMQNKVHLQAVLWNAYSCSSATFPTFAGGRSAPSLTGLQIVETNQEITAPSCTTADSCRYTMKCCTSSEPALSRWSERCRWCHSLHETSEFIMVLRSFIPVWGLDSQTCSSLCPF